ncbi:MAG: hypothetical protein ACW98X_08650 [Promethearchaeota archaeon]|jgi:hypothetical protein
MNALLFQALIKTLKLANIPKFVSLVDQITQHSQNNLTNSKKYDNFRTDLEKAYYFAISKTLKSMKNNFIKGKEDFIQLFNYSDKLGIFIDVSNIDVEGIISELHIDGLNKGLRSRIIELVSFFNEYNLFERNFTTDEIKIIQDIKKENKLLALNLKDVFGTVSDSLIFYVCKVMSYDYVKWIRDMLKNPRAHRFLMSPNSLRNWTDGFPIYGLIVRNLGRVEDFIKRIESKQNIDEINEEMILLEFNPRYIVSSRENRILRTFSEQHIVYPNNILKIKKKILNKENYNFYSLSMVIFGGLGPEGLGFTYSTPKGEVIEICSDQKETEAIVIKFKQYLKAKFLDKFEKEMDSLGINLNIRKTVINYLKDIINPKDSISYYSRNSIVRKIQNFLLQIDEFQRMDQPKIEAIIEKISFAISLILKRVKLKDQFMTRMDLVANGKLKSEDVAKLTSLRGKSHYDVLRERMFLQNKPKWFFINYPKEIMELETEFQKLYKRIYDRDIELNFDY